MPKNWEPTYIILYTHDRNFRIGTKYNYSETEASHLVLSLIAVLTWHRNIICFNLNNNNVFHFTGSYYSCNNCQIGLQCCKILTACDKRLVAGSTIHNDHIGFQFQIIHKFLRESTNNLLSNFDTHTPREFNINF